jgi:hypothetical protein
MQTKYGFSLDKWEAAKREMQEFLAEQARKCKTISYGDLSKMIPSLTLDPRDNAMYGMLDEISRDNAAIGKTSLATLVVQKSSGRPGTGYFRKTFPQHLPPEELEALWQQELQRVCADWSKE